jgi:hypothetical protein
MKGITLNYAEKSHSLTKGRKLFMNLEMYSEEMTIKLEVNPGPGYEGDPYGLDLQNRAIVSLIEHFDTHFAQEEGLYWENDQFYASILSAIARHSMVDMPDDITMSVYDVLIDLLKWLSSEGMLQETITSGVADDYDEYDE